MGETPLHKPYPYCLYIGEYLHFRYLKSLVKSKKFQKSSPLGSPRWILVVFGTSSVLGQVFPQILRWKKNMVPFFWGSPVLGGSSHLVSGKSLIPGVVGPLPNGRTPWLINGGDRNYLVAGMILQVGNPKPKHNEKWLLQGGPLLVVNGDITPINGLITG